MINEKLGPLGFINPSSVSPNFIEWLNTIESYDVSSIIWRLTQKEGRTDQEAFVARISFLRFISLIKLHEELDFSPNRDQDDFWHAFILHTREYLKFCNYFFGYFIHHEPFNPTTTKSSLAQQQVNATTKFMLKKYYGVSDQDDEQLTELCISVNFE